MNEVNTVSTNLNHFREFVCQKLFDIVRKKKSAACPKANGDRTSVQYGSSIVFRSEINSGVKQKFLLQANRIICLNQRDIAVYVKRQRKGTIG